MLTKEELERYDRQIKLRGFGLDGQRKLKSAKVLIAGVGGLGSPSAIYLACAGVGKIIVVDKENVELSNLNRQILYSTEDVGRSKAEVAAKKLRSINPSIDVEGINMMITKDNIDGLVKEVDVVVDGQDNYTTRYIINEACVKYRVPFVHAAVLSYEGRLMTIVPGKGPCYRCLLPEPPPEMDGFPVLGTVPGTIATLQATEVLKIILGMGDLLVGKMLIYDALSTSFMVINVERDPECPVCSGVR